MRRWRKEWQMCVYRYRYMGIYVDRCDRNIHTARTKKENGSI